MIHKLRFGIHRRGLHLIAIFEALKGLVVLGAGLDVLRYIHQDLHSLGESLTIHLGLHDQYSQLILNMTSKIGPREIVIISGLAVAYSLLRFIEAYGLWKQRTWAQWLAIISGAIYLPIEFYSLYQQITIHKIMITGFNILVIAYLFWIKFKDDKARAALLNETN